MRKIIFITFFVFIRFASYSCTDIVVGKMASTDSSVIISHTDCGDDCRLRIVHGQKYKLGTMTPVYWGLQDVDRDLNDFGDTIGFIPQVSETYTYFHSAYSHINEYQLSIAESTTSMREGLKIVRKESKQIMTIEQATIFALQRCKKAKDAVKLISNLMNKYGFLPSCVDESESLCIADPDEVWVLEVFSVGAGWSSESGKPGAIWAAQRVPDDHVLIIPNWSIIKEIHIEDTVNFMASENYMQVAIDSNWYNPESGKPFIWQKAYTPISREWAMSRFWLFYSQVAPNYTKWPDRSLKNQYAGMLPYVQYVEDLDLYPFSVKPENKLSVQDVMAFQRSTFEGTIYDMTSDPDWYIPQPDDKSKLSPLATPFPTKPMRELLDINWRRNVSRGGYGMICQLRSWMPKEIGGIYYFYQDNQYVSTYIPIYTGVLSLHKSLSIYNPNKFDDNSLRWNYDFVDNLLYLKWQNAYNDLLAVRNPLEEKMFEDIKITDEKALQLYKKNPNKAAAFVTDFVSNHVDKVLKMYQDLRYQLLIKYTNNKQGS